VAAPTSSSPAKAAPPSSPPLSLDHEEILALRVAVSSELEDVGHSWDLARQTGGDAAYWQVRHDRLSRLHARLGTAGVRLDRKERRS
jgi:hypothetical protein